MPTYSMRAPNGRTYRVSGPPGATDAQVRAEILRQFPDAGGVPPKPKPKKKSFLQKAEEFGEAALTGVAEGIRPVSEFAQTLSESDEFHLLRVNYGLCETCFQNFLCTPHNNCIQIGLISNPEQNCPLNRHYTFGLSNLLLSFD